MDSKIEIYLIAFFISFILFIIGLISFFILFKNKQRLSIKEKMLLQKEFQQSLLQTQLEVQQQTMDYIGREIHDNVGQKLTLASLLSQQLLLSLKDNRISDVIHSIDEGLEDLRNLSKSLTVTGLVELSFLELLNMQVKNVELLKKEKLHIQVSPNCQINSPQTKLILLRIVQEFIQNSLKHAQCKNIDISIKIVNDEIDILLQDDGIGFDAKKIANGIGLANMQKRAALIPATFTLNSTLNKGTIINLRIKKELNEA